MRLFDFGINGATIRKTGGLRKVGQYVTVAGGVVLPIDAFFKANTIISCDTKTNTAIWIKDRYGRQDEILTAEEYDQIFFKMLKGEAW